MGWERWERAAALAARGIQSRSGTGDGVVVSYQRDMAARFHMGTGGHSMGRRAGHVRLWVGCLRHAANAGHVPAHICEPYGSGAGVCGACRHLAGGAGVCVGEGLCDPPQLVSGGTPGAGGYAHCSWSGIVIIFCPGAD